VIDDQMSFDPKEPHNDLKQQLVREEKIQVKLSDVPPVDIGSLTTVDFEDYQQLRQESERDFINKVIKSQYSNIQEPLR
jgi:hypothetical protein